MNLFGVEKLEIGFDQVDFGIVDIALFFKVIVKLGFKTALATHLKIFDIPGEKYRKEIRLT